MIGRFTYCLRFAAQVFSRVIALNTLARDHISPLVAQLCFHRDQRESGLSPSLSPYRICSRKLLTAKRERERERAIVCTRVLPTPWSRTIRGEH